MGKVVQIFDGLLNAINGAGSRRDARASYRHAATCLTQADIDAAYRGSGMLRKIIQIPAMDMVREWRDWKIESDQITLIEVEEKRLGIRQKVRQAEVLRGLGGGALILGLPGDPSQPAPTTIGKGGLAYIHVVSRWHLNFDRLQDDARLPGYGEPAMWKLSQVGGQATIHPSRVIPFRADTSAMMATYGLAGGQVDEFWGESTVAQVLDAVTDSDAARGAFASMLHKARITRVGIPDLSGILSMPGGEARIQSRLEVIALAESMFNAAVFDSGSDGKTGEQITDVQYNFAGAKDVINAYAEFVSAVSDIPATRLLGRAPDGMNSSGQSQQVDWGKKIKAMQELDLAPCLDRLDPYLLASALGTVPADAWYNFAPLDMPSEKDNADRFKVQVEAMEKLANMGVIPDRAFAEAAQSLMVEEGYMPALEAALAAIPEDERFGIEPDLSESPPEIPAAPTEEGGDQSADLKDAAPRTLYVQRKLLNAEEFIAWAKGQGFEATVPADELHVTITYSRTALDWLKVESAWDGEDGQLTVPPGGARVVEPLGDKGAVVLLFNSSTLAWRHRQIIEAGASHDYSDYQPHVTITYEGAGVDLSKVEPFRGRLVFGPEIFEELDLDWKPSAEAA